MAKFNYQARTANGQAATGQIEASDEAEARVKLRARSLTPVRLAVVNTAARDARSTARVNSRDLQIFTRQLSTLVNAGIPIVESLRMLSQGQRGEVLKAAATHVRVSIEAGKRLAEGMQGYPGVFDKLYVNMVHAGEQAGILDSILSRLAIYLEKSEKLKKQVRGAMVYPGAIVAVSGIVVTGILVFIIPKFQELYNSSGRELPALTKMVIGLSQAMIKRWYIFVGVIFGGGYFFRQYARTPEGKNELDRILIRIPVFGDLVQKSGIAKMCRTLGTLLASGVGVVDALEIAAKTAGNIVLEEALLRSKESVVAGKPLAAPLMREPLIPEMVTQMISIGEKSGMMDAMFNKIADFYEDDVENAVKAVTSLIEPILMVFLGGIIAVIVLAMYLPIFDMANMGGK